MCRYLVEGDNGGDGAGGGEGYEGGVEFVGVENDAGNGPLDHVVAYGRGDVVGWLLGLEGGRREGTGDSGVRVYDLAVGFL